MNGIGPNGKSNGTRLKSVKFCAAQVWFVRFNRLSHDLVILLAESPSRAKKVFMLFCNSILWAYNFSTPNIGVGTENYCCSTRFAFWKINLAQCSLRLTRETQKEAQKVRNIFQWKRGVANNIQFLNVLIISKLHWFRIELYLKTHNFFSFKNQHYQK